MSKTKMNVAINKSTKELIGYTKGKNPIVVSAYAMDDLEKAFNRVLLKRKKAKKSKGNYDKNIEILAGQDKYEIDLMIKSNNDVVDSKPKLVHSDSTPMIDPDYDDDDPF